MPTLDGEQAVDVRAGTQPGAVIELHGHGMPSLRRGRRGDQRVVVNVVVPRNLSDEQRSLLEQLSATLTDDNVSDHADDGSLFSRVRRAFR